MTTEPPLTARLEVIGVAETLKKMRAIDPELRKATLKRMRQAGDPIVSAARALIPAETPLSNWGNWRGGYTASRVRSSIRASTRTGRVRGKGPDHFPLLSVRSTSAAGVIFDMAGRRSGGKTASGAAMIRQLNTYRQASRSMWPAAEQNIGQVQAQVRKAIDDMVAALDAQYPVRAVGVLN